MLSVFFTNALKQYLETTKNVTRVRRIQQCKGVTIKYGVEEAGRISNFAEKSHTPMQESKSFYIAPKYLQKKLMAKDFKRKCEVQKVLQEKARGSTQVYLG